MDKAKIQIIAASSRITSGKIILGSDA